MNIEIDGVPMTMVDEVEINARFLALTEQRNNAMNQAAILAGNLAAMAKKVEKLSKQIEELTKAPEEEQTTDSQPQE